MSLVVITIAVAAEADAFHTEWAPKINALTPVASSTDFSHLAIVLEVIDL